MKSLAFNHLTFPKRPKNNYLTAPIYLEPMRGSGERITVVGVVVGLQEFLVERLISSEIAEAMYGKQAGALLGFADMIVSDLTAHLSHSEVLSWKPCMAGVEMGSLQESYADNPRHALSHVAMLHASLCKLPALMALEEDENDEPADKDNTLLSWVKQVQNQAICNAPDWKTYFNVKEFLADGDSITLHFARKNLAVNIGLITPSRLAPRINDAKIKLWNLDHLPSQYNDRRLLLGIPRDDAPEMANHKIKEAVQGKIAALYTEAKNNNITVQTAYTAQQAVELLAA